MAIQLKNENTGLGVKCPIGFSWTTLLFGCFVPAFRGMWGYAAISFLLAWVTLGISWLVFPFIINKHYARHLIEKGYTPVTDKDLEKVRAMGIQYQPNEKKAA